MDPSEILQIQLPYLPQRVMQDRVLEPVALTTAAAAKAFGRKSIASRGSARGVD
jgi:hypothetical protein